MRHNITQQDKMLLLQSEIHYKYRLYILDQSQKILEMLEGVSNIGNYTINSDSTIRRTTSFVLCLDDTYSNQNIERKISEWIGYDFELQIGIYSIRADEYIWYKCGTYTITQTNTNYDAKTSTLTTNLSDWFAKLNGDRNGQMGGAPTISIPNIDANGNKTTIQQAAIGVVKNTGLNQYIIQDVGEFYGMEQSPGYLEYRLANPNWNQLPYDLEYSCGVHTSEILEDIRDLYPNCEMFFDVFNNFCFNMIPSCDNDPIVLDNDYLQDIILAENSESVSYDIAKVANVTEVFGRTYDVDRFAETCAYSNNIYTINLDNYVSYLAGAIIAFNPSSTNTQSPYLRINSLEAIPIYEEYTSNNIGIGTIKKDEMCCVKIAYVNGAYSAYFLGQYQPHAICVLTGDINDNVYTKEYFAQKYNCNNIVFRVENSPFVIQKKGFIFETLSGDVFDNILSDSVASSTAVFYNRQHSTLYDTVTITTKMIPFLDVNVKVSYRKQQESEEHEYIVKSVDNNLSGNTTEITMYRFSTLYYD